MTSVRVERQIVKVQSQCCAAAAPLRRWVPAAAAENFDREHRRRVGNLVSVMHSTLCVHVCTHQGDPCSGTAGTVRRGTLVPQQHAQFAAAVRSQLHHLLTLLLSLCALSVPLAAAVAAR